MYERSQSHLGHSAYSALMFNNGKMEGADAGDAIEFSDVSGTIWLYELSHNPWQTNLSVDVYNNAPSADLYFGGTGGASRSSMIVGGPASGLMKQLSHPAVHLDTSSMSVNRSQSNNSLRSGPIEMGTPIQSSTPVKSPPSLVSTVLDLNVSPGSGAMNFVLNENVMKNLNQLAQLNDGASGNSASVQSANNCPNSIFGRSASAMASMGNNMTAASSLASVMAVHQMVAHGTNNIYGQLSHSPSLNSGSKSPTGMAGTPNGSLMNGASGPSHTTGNGKNHKIMQIRCKFGSLGPQTNQFSSPHGFCLGVNEEIVIADTNNHRICVYEKNGTFKHAFGNAGKDEGQLWYPRKVNHYCHQVETTFLIFILFSDYHDMLCKRSWNSSESTLRDLRPWHGTFTNANIYSYRKFCSKDSHSIHRHCRRHCRQHLRTNSNCRLCFAHYLHHFRDW